MENRNLYFIDSRGKYRLLHENVKEKEVYLLIQLFLDEHNFKSYYTRSWNTNEGTMYDVGSHTEFFLWGIIMIKLEKTDVYGWEAAIRGMRNPMNSWNKSDSDLSCKTCDGCYYETEKHIEEYEHQTDCWCNKNALRIGENDLKLMKTLAKSGNDHGKFLRMLTVTVDITAPLYWWKEFDTYKVGTVANSCSTMHKIQAKEFTFDDFSCEHLTPESCVALEHLIGCMEANRKMFLALDGEEAKTAWWQMIQLLPSSYNQKRTVQLNYQVLKTMYYARRHHKLDEWHTLCEWMETLPYFKEICLQE